MRQSETAIQDERMGSTMTFNLTKGIEDAFNADKTFYCFGDIRSQICKNFVLFTKKVINSSTTNMCYTTRDRVTLIPE